MEPFFTLWKEAAVLIYELGLDNEEPLLHHLLSKSKESNVIIPDENSNIICIQVIEIYQLGMV